MPGLPFEIVHTGDVRKGSLVQDSHGSDEILASIFSVVFVGKQPRARGFLEVR